MCSTSSMTYLVIKFSCFVTKVIKFIELTTCIVVLKTNIKVFK